MSWLPSPAYRSGIARLAVNTSRGHWIIYDIKDYDPKMVGVKDVPVVGHRTNRKDAVKLARGMS